MSAFARKQLEKYGWKEGDGLGRDGSGISSYIRTSRHNRPTHNRDEKGASYAGIGHASTQGGGASTAEKATELDSVLAEMLAARQKREKKERKEKERQQQQQQDVQQEEEEEEEEGEATEQVVIEVPEKKKSKRRQRDDEEERAEEKGEGGEQQRRTSTKAKQEEERDESDFEEVVPAKIKLPKPSPKLTATAAPTSFGKKSKSVAASSSCSDDDDAVGANGGTLTDAQLFERCGGVRLGRSGRHRFFDHKLKRIEESNKKK